MPEYEELRLEVSLIDNATQGLAKLRQNLRDLGGSENRESLQRMQQEVEKVSEKMTKMRDHMSRTERAAESLGRTIGNSIRAFGAAFVSSFALNSLKTFTDEMVRLDATARQFGVGGAQLKSLVEQMGVMGIGAPQATQAVTGFANALAELGRNGSQLRENVMRGALSNPQAMAQLLQRLTGLGSKGEIEKALREFLDAANDVYQNELNRTKTEQNPEGNKGMASQRRNEWLQMFQFDPATAAMIVGQLRDVTDAEKAEYDRRAAIAQSYNQQWNAMALKYKDFVRGLQEGMLPTLEAINTKIGTMGDKWGEALGDELTKTIKKAVDELTFLYNLITNPKQAIKDQAMQAHPTLQSGARALGLNVPTTEENKKKWEEQRKKGQGTIFDNPFASDIERDNNAPRSYFGETVTPPASPMSYRGGDSMMPRAIKASLGGAPIRVPGGNADYSRSSGSAMTDFTRAVRIGTFDALVDFRAYLQGGGKGGGGGGGGAQNASLTTGPDSTSANPSSTAPSSTAPTTTGPSTNPDAPDVANPFGGTRTSITPTAGGGPSGVNPFGGMRTGVGAAANALGGARTSVSGAATPAGDASTDMPADSGAAVGKGGSAYRAEQRAALFAEYDKWSPEQKRTLQNVMRAENANSTADVLESLANRVPGEKGTKANRGGTLWEGLSSGFYSSFPAAQAAARRGQGDIAAADKAAAAVRGGSDVLEGRTDQGMWTDPGHRDMHPPGAAPGTQINPLGVARRLKYINGEWYSDKQSIPLSARDRDLAAKATFDAARAKQNTAASKPSASARGDIEQFDSDMGNEITTRVDGAAKVTVDVGGTKAPPGKNRSRLFSKIETPRARQMVPAETGPAVDGVQSGVEWPSGHMLN